MDELDIGLTWFHLVFLGVPGLVNVYITNWKITMLLMGKSTISMAIFNSLLYVYLVTRGYPFF
jgi:hypothetical protein